MSQFHSPPDLLSIIGDLQTRLGALELSQVRPLTSSAWITPTLINSWVSGGEGTPAYLKDALGFVHLRGYLTTGASGTVAFVLPAGFRPGATTFYPSLQGSGVAGSYINIDTSGNVNCTYTTAGARLTAVTFLAEN